MTLIMRFLEPPTQIYMYEWRCSVMMETLTDSWQPLMIGTWGDDAHAVDALHLWLFPGGRPNLIAGPKASDNRGFEKRQVGGWSQASWRRGPNGFAEW